MFPPALEEGYDAEGMQGAVIITVKLYSWLEHPEFWGSTRQKKKNPAWLFFLNFLFYITV